MRFIERKHRSPPPIIIVSLIDILIVLLIFLMVTTTFKQQPTVKITLPQTRQGREGKSDTSQAIIISMPTNSPIYLGLQPITLDHLQAELAVRAGKDPNTSVAIRVDKATLVQDFLNVSLAVKVAGFKKEISVWTQPGLKP
jgi:biopolymer transport protein ExbD